MNQWTAGMMDTLITIDGRQVKARICPVCVLRTALFPDAVYDAHVARHGTKPESWIKKQRARAKKAQAARR